jgi:2-haloacid dehalogenase/putative hydrolase of the HAD superfamily
MTGAARPAAVLWDIGNVVVRWDPRLLYTKIFPDPIECDRFLGEVCTLAWHADTDRGVTFAENTAKLAALHPHHAESINAWHGRWWEMFDGVIAETEAAILALAEQGVPQFGLTNMSAEVWPGVRAMTPAFEHFIDVVVSGTERVIKPEPRIFEIACERAGLRPQEMLFVDDSAANIAAAEALGFVVHRFDDPAALRPALERHGLL